MQPAGLQVAAVPVYCPNVALCVVSTLQDSGRFQSVEVSHGSIEALGTSTVAVAPEAVDGCSTAVFATCTVRTVPDGLHSSTRSSVENGEELLATRHISFRVLVGLAVVCSLDVGSTSLTDIFAGSIGASGSRPADHLCLAVAVEVIDEERHGVVSGTDVMTEVDEPFLRAVHLVAGQDGGRCFAFLTRVALVVGQPLDDHLELTVAIDVADAEFIRTVAAGNASRGILQGAGTLHVDGLIHVVPCLYGELLAVGGFDGIGGTSLTAVIQKVGLGGDGCAVQLDAATIDVKTKVGGITLQRPPRH